MGSVLGLRGECVVVGRVCRGCDVSLVGRDPRAVWCSRQCSARNRKRLLFAPVVDPVGDTDLVVSVRAALVKADAMGSVEGLLALEVARQLPGAGPDRVVRLVGEVRALLAAATGVGLPPSAEAGPVSPEVPISDEVARARRRFHDFSVGEAGAG